MDVKIIVQRVKGRTRIDYDGQTWGFEGPGLVVLLGWTKQDDTKEDLESKEDWLMSRVLGLRIFPDNDGKMNLSLQNYLEQNRTPGGILWVPQFTLAAELLSGFRPSFTGAMAPDQARFRFAIWKNKLQNFSNINHVFGRFGADMELTFTNWGPVTIPLEL